MLGDYCISYRTKTSGDYPLDDQIGVGIDPKTAASEPPYAVHNTQGGGANWPVTNSIWGVSMTGAVNPDRDYYDTAPGFNGASGVGRGTKAQMLAISPTKTNVGYWVTDEGSWDTTKAPNTSGQLYIWSGSAWVLKYTPYIYPHPRNVAVAGLKPAQARWSPPASAPASGVSPKPGDAR